MKYFKVYSILEGYAVFLHRFLFFFYIAISLLKNEGQVKLKFYVQFSQELVKKIKYLCVMSQKLFRSFENLLIVGMFEIPLLFDCVSIWFRSFDHLLFVEI